MKTKFLLSIVIGSLAWLGGGSNISAANANAGLWVGEATVKQVGQYLKSYHRDPTRKPLVKPDGKYEVIHTNTALASVNGSFPLRLIVHNPEKEGQARLLQRVYVGLDAATNSVIATGQKALNRALLSQARRLSASHLPWTKANSGWAFDGLLAPGKELTATVTLDHNDHASNPFLHTYHPDHDNLDVHFKKLAPQGSESYQVVRKITLNITTPVNDSDGSAAAPKLEGKYSETIQIVGLARKDNTNDTKRFEVRGVFTLYRVNAVPKLTSTP